MESLLYLEQLILEENPSIFLFNPHFNFFVREEYRGIGPVEQKMINSSKRFENIDQWFLRTRRVFER